jgi:hypothetical protein
VAIGRRRDQLRALARDPGGFPREQGERLCLDAPPVRRARSLAELSTGAAGLLIHGIYRAVRA